MKTKIGECIDSLEKAHLAIAATPQKGFLNLDRVTAEIEQVMVSLRAALPAISLGDRLAADYLEETKQKLKVLETAGNPLVSQAAAALDSGKLDYTSLKALRDEIDCALSRIFKGVTKPVSAIGDRQNEFSRPEDFQ